MNCEAFRESIGAQPHLEDDATAAHAAACEACAAYRREVREMERLIARALSIEVPQANAPNVAPRRQVARWALAASVLAAAGLSIGLWLANPSTSLARDVVEHAQGEASAIVTTSKRVAPQSLDAVLRAAHLRLQPNVLQVSYVMSCEFHGHRVPHLVVQTPSGPVTVLVLRHEPVVTQPRNFEEGEFRGVIVPAPQGVLAVLSRGAAVDPAARMVLSAIEYDAI